MMKKIMLIAALVVGMGGMVMKDVKAGYDDNGYDPETGTYNTDFYEISICLQNKDTEENCVSGLLQGNNPYDPVLCPSGSFAVCGIDGSGGKDPNASDLCSCLKPRTNHINDAYKPGTVDKTDSNYSATNTCVCAPDSNNFYYPADESNDCKDGLVPLCHDGTLKANGRICLCSTAQVKYEFEKGISIYNNSPLQPTYAYDVANNINDVNLHNASISSTTHIYNPICGNNGISTAFGCIPYSASGIATKLLEILFGIGGGIAFLLMVYGFILVATSSGDEKKLQAAKETITSAVTGLLVSIFALFLFRLIAVNILKIPGLS